MLSISTWHLALLLCTVALNSRHSVLAQQLNRLVCTSLNHVIQQQSWAQNRLRPFSGATIAILGLPFTLSLQITEQGIFSSTDASQVADVTLQLPPDALGRSLFAFDQMASAVKITGAVDIAEALGFVLRNLHWDIESDIAKLIGDIPAHRLARTGLSLQSQLSTAAERLTQNLIEFTRDESTLLVGNTELSEFCQSVDQLRDDLARIEQRIRHL